MFTLRHVADLLSSIELDRLTGSVLGAAREAAGLCSEARADAKTLEDEAREWLQSITVQASWRDLYASARSSRTRRTPSPEERRHAIEAKILRLRVSWESGARTDEAGFRREVGALRQELEEIEALRPPQRVKQTATIASLSDRWNEMDSAQRRRLLGTIFETITMKDGALYAAKPKSDSLEYLETVTAIPEPRSPLGGLGRIELPTPALGRPRSVH